MATIDCQLCQETVATIDCQLCYQTISFYKHPEAMQQQEHPHALAASIKHTISKFRITNATLF